MDEACEYLRQLAPFFCRIAGALALLPLDSGIQGLALRLSLAAAGAVFIGSILPAAEQVSAAGLVLEFVLGALLSLPVLVVLSSSAMLGELFDVARGQSVAELYDPSSARNVSSCSMFFEKYAVVLLLAAGMPDRLLAVILRSFQVLGRADEVTPWIERAKRAVEFIPVALGEFCWFFLPVLLVFSLIDLVFACFGRFLPQTALQTEIMLAKSVTGLALLACMQNQQGWLQLLGLAFAENWLQMLP